LGYPGNSDRAAMRRAYFACVSYVDAQVGKVLDELDALGLADNTVVVLWGDHGWCLDDYTLLGKHVVLEHVAESPLIIRPPASFRPEVYAGVPATGIAETVDIYPTIAELCGLAPPPGPAGSSLVPMLRNPFAPGKEYAYTRYGGVSTIRTPTWRLINSGSDNDLYDLSTARYETADVSTSNPAVVSELTAKLNVQGTRPGTTYLAWAGGNPQLADPDADADADGSPNLLEYASGTDPLDPGSRPIPVLTTEDLTGLGFSAQEIVYSVIAATLPDDLTLVPATSINLIDWSFADLGGDRTQLRFRLAPSADPRRFFRSATSTN
jgi:hypothetical protein